MRLNRAIDVLRKFKIDTNFNILKTACHSLFESHLKYGAKLWHNNMAQLLGQKTMKQQQHYILRTKRTKIIK